MPIKTLMPAASLTLPTPRSPLRMQGSIEGPAVFTASASMDTCMRRYERSVGKLVSGIRGNGMFEKFVGWISRRRNPPLDDSLVVDYGLCPNPPYTWGMI